MKIKKFLSLMLLVLVAVLLVACGDKSQDIADENIEKIAITYATGDSASNVNSDITLGKVELEGLTVEWASDKEAVISKEGKVTKPAAGEKDVTVKLTVTVTYKDATASKDFTLVVKAYPEIKPLSIEISGAEKMIEGAVADFTATVAPENATNKAITWESDNTEVATVDANGKVTAVKDGTANIIAKSVAVASVEASFAVTVVKPAAETIEATQAKAKGEQGWCKGVVVATYKRGYLIADGTSYILVYTNNTAFEQKIGDYVEVKGVLGEYNGAKQFDATATVTVAEGEAPSVDVKAEKFKDGAAVAAYMDAFVMFKKITVRVTVTSRSDSYINCVVKDSQVGVCICYPADKDAYKDATDYDLTAYALYTKEYNSVTSVYVMQDKAIEVDYGFDVNITYKDGTVEDKQTINSLEFPVMTLPEPEAKEGFVFLGWYNSDAANAVKVFSVYAPEDVTLYAKWVAEADAPLFVDPACEDGSAYTTLSDAIAAAKEGQEIYLAPGEYAEELITPVARTYNTIEALKAAYIADFIAAAGRTSGDVGLFDTLSAESLWMKTVLENAEMTAKWSWLYKALAEAAENDDMDPETFTPENVKFNYMANLYGLFSGTQHTDGGMKSYTSANFASAKLVQKVLLAGPKVNEEETDAVASKIVINKTVKIVGPNANVHGHNDARNEEAAFNSIIEITAANVVIDGCAFLGDSAAGIGADNVTITNCYFKTTKFVNYGADNRKGSIANMANVKGFTLLNTYICTPGTSYLNEAIAIDGNGMTDVTIDSCYFDTEATTPAGYECIIAYNLFGQFIFTNNECYFTTTGYFARLGLYLATLTYALVKNNIFAGVGDNGNATFAFAKIKDNGATIEFIHNKFYNFQPSTIILGAAATVKTNFLYNYFDEKTPWKFQNGTSINFDYNLVLGEAQEGNQVDATAQANKPADLDALEAAYAIYDAEFNREATITFDVDGGEAIEPLKFKNAKEVVLPTPVKNDYVFDGWYSGETKVEAIAEKVDVTLKAKWIKINHVTFDVDGGNAVQTIDFTDYTKVTALPAATKEGKAFMGWYEGEVKVESITENRDYALKAQWADAKTVTFDVDGGDAIQTLGFIDFAAVVLPKATKAGFRFMGWYDGETKVEALTENKDYTLKAQWAQEYTVSFDVDGGYAVEPVKVISLEELKAAVFPVASKDNAFFKAWMVGEATLADAINAMSEVANVSAKATYDDLATKLAALQAGDTLVFGAAKYTLADGYTVTVDNVTFKGVDYNTTYAKNYAFDATAPHTVFDGFKVLLADGVKGFTMEGITLTGVSGLAGNGVNQNVTFKNNILNNIGTVTCFGTSDGIVGFYQAKDIVIANNAICGTDATARVFRFSRVENLTFTGNIFTDSFGGYSKGAGGDLLRVDDGGATTGTIIISNNIFQNATQVAVHTRPVADALYISENNYFYNCEAAYWLRDLSGKVNVVIAYNYIEGGCQTGTWDVLGCKLGYETFVCTYNYFVQHSLASGCASIYATGTNNYVANNYFEDKCLISATGVVAADVVNLADPKAVAFMSNSAFDAWMGKGLYYSSFADASAAEALAAGSKLVLLSGNYSGTITKQLYVSSVLDQLSVADNAYLYESAAAATINGELVYKAVAKAGLDHVAITGAGQVFTYGVAMTKFAVDNVYAFDSTFTPVTYALNGITNSGEAGTTTKIAVIQVQAYQQWNGGLSFTNCKFEDINGGAIWVIAVTGGLTVDNCSFKNVAYDAITTRYSGGTGGNVTVTNCSFDTIGANGLYIRSATGSWTGNLNATVKDCSFKNVAYNKDALSLLDSSTNYGCIVTRGYGEKYSVDFTIEGCSFELCNGYINIRDNATTTETWRAKGVHYLVSVKYCKFIVAADNTNISHSWAGSDSATTNVGDMTFDNNFYGKYDNEAVVAATVTYDQILATSNATTYTTVADLEAAYAAYKNPVTD